MKTLSKSSKSPNQTSYGSKLEQVFDRSATLGSCFKGDLHENRIDHWIPMLRLGGRRRGKPSTSQDMTETHFQDGRGG